MGFGRYVFQQLEREADAYLVCIGHQGKEAVVISLTPTKACAMAAECHTGDDGKVYLVIRIHGKEFARWFHYAVSSLLQ